MLVYWVMFLLPVLFELQPLKMSPSVRKVLLFLLGVFYTVVIGLRYEVGGDWWGYGASFLSSTEFPLFAFLTGQNEVGYEFLNRLFSHAGLQIWAVNMVCAVLVVSGVLAIASRQLRPFTALAVSVPYLLIVVAMGYTRQSAAIGIVCWALIALEERRTFRFLLLVLMASLMHKTALIVLPLVLYVIPAGYRRYVVVIGAFLASFAFMVKWSALQAKFREYDGTMVSYGALPRMLVTVLSAGVVLLERKVLGGGGKKAYLSGMAWSLLMAFPLVFFYSTIIDRLALYALPLQIMVFGNIDLFFCRNIERIVVRVSVLVFYTAMLFVWLNFSVVRLWWVPYRFTPISELSGLPDRYVNQAVYWSQGQREFGDGCYMTRQLPISYKQGYSRKPLTLSVRTLGPLD